ncbi:MAG: hypothetical protein Q7O66_08450 [Dehalococcoidia bacterium]|nr:hypothetical protein [Dehalococcoidia bacterium]
MEAEQTDTRYHVDTDWYKQRGRSFEVMGQSRMCPNCKKKLGTETEERVPKIDQKSGRVAFENRKVPFGSNPFVVLRDCCGKKKEFIGASTPILESVFRLLLANANQPLTLEDLKQKLEETGNYTQSGHFISAEVLKRLIDHDQQYGIRPITILPAL